MIEGRYINLNKIENVDESLLRKPED